MYNSKSMMSFAPCPYPLLGETKFSSSYLTYKGAKAANSTVRERGIHPLSFQNDTECLIYKRGASGRGSIDSGVQIHHDVDGCDEDFCGDEDDYCAHRLKLAPQKLRVGTRTRTRTLGKEELS